MHLTNGPVAPGAISDLVAKGGQNHDCGAHSLFIGQVRSDQTDGKYIRAIEYSAYEEMVIGEADKIYKSILSEFSDVKAIDIIHSKGLVKAGEISLLVMVSAGHRDHASRACAKTVELIQEKLPIFKKEIFEDNSRQRKGNE